MSSYRKAWVAVLGGFVEVAMVVGEALDAGVVPDGWAPALRVVVAVGTAVAVYAVPNLPAGRHELGGDAG